ncbi:MAG TPA: PBP1A family penicillin-binding protein [Hellea balneolensis]|uniref:PBP1A family penicillin-binding protein n=1 Tax=Hellea balneolensis TaxID=287478 RepID=A0A7C3C151_9PROT|nr:PBP1A family penicillin-binding protein [Hellea balneolensis]
MYTYRADIGAANDNKNRKRARIAWTVLILFALIAGMAYFTGRKYLLSGLPDLPDKQAMWEMNVQSNMTLLDKDGNIIGHRGPFYGRPLQLSEIPSYLTDAFLAIEDQRFYEHAGIDRKAIFRALLENAKAGRKVQGASTLTQQLVKNMVLSPKKTYKRKVQEMWLSYQMEQELTKPEILELYLNRIDLGNRSFGVEAASLRYFGKSATDISLAEAAILAALPKAPTAYDPIKHPDASKKRAELVLGVMMEQGKISPEEMNEALLNIPTLTGNESTYLDADALGHVFDVVADKAGKLVGSQNKDLIVYTTIDTQLQKHALKTVNTVIQKYQKSKKVTEGALVSVSTETGAIRALIGGRSYTKSKFNRVTQASRQPGSSFKAFVYAAALEAGMTPGTVRIDQPIDINGWQPENYTHRYRGPITIREALKLSINTVAAQVGAEIGPTKVVELAKRFGITTELGAHYSIALGSSEVHLMDMVAAFMVFANEGEKQTPFIITKITDTSNTVLYSHKTVMPERVYALPYARQMTSILYDAIETGTGHGARLKGRQAAGKTGTSQDYRDAWFIGFTANYATGVWFGNDNNTPMVKVTGGLLPVDAWKMFMLKAHKGLAKRPLNAPAPIAADSEAMAFTVFYQKLSDQFLAERNLANGANPKASTARQN